MEKITTWADMASVTLDAAWLGENPIIDHVTEPAVRRQLEAVPALCKALSDAWDRLSDSEPDVSGHLEEIARELRLDTSKARTRGEILIMIRHAVRDVVNNLAHAEESLQETKDFIAEMEAGMEVRIPGSEDFFIGEEYSVNDFFSEVLDPVLRKLNVEEQRRLRAERDLVQARTRLGRLRIRKPRGRRV